MMLNFLCQLDWDIGSPDTWLSIILGMSEGASIGDYCLNRLSKADCSPCVGEVGLIQSLEA